MISRDTIDKIYQAAIIEDVVGEFVHLKKSGSAYKGLSPFANEKTPSFFVVPAKGIYKDFSSGKGGNVVDFLMQHEKLSYPEALRWLAARYQIEIEEDQQTAEQQQEKSEREQLSIVTEFAAKYFQETLHQTEEGRAIGLSYFQERGFREDIINKFQLGYCPDKWDAMTKAALEQQYKSEYLIKAGLTRERDGSLYDFFRGRVMFPIHNISGKVIAFGGRTLKAEKEIAKYFNSPESELYIKSNVLYGMHLAKNAIVKNDMCYLVEGYTDVISMHQAGVENVVASSGTSLTEGQIRLIRRYTQNITILYDGDSAGIKASFRGIDMILKEGMNVRVLLFPDGDDPDSFARKHSSQEIQEFIAKNARDFISFKTSLLLEDAGHDPVKRAALIRGIVDSIALIPDGITRSVYVQECSRLLNMQEQVLLTELNKVILTNYKKDHKSAPNTPEELPVLEEIPADGVPGSDSEEITLYFQEKDLVRLLLNYGDKPVEITITNEDGHEEKHFVSVAEYLIANIEQDEIHLMTPVYANIYKEYVEFIGREEIPQANNFTQHHDTGISAESSGLLVSPYQLSENWTTRHMIYPETEEMLLRKAVKDCIFRLKLWRVKHIAGELDKEIAESSDNEEKLEALMKEKMLLNKAKLEIAKYFGTALL
ncbi:MAG: DNA primase [Flavobacteriales bacterium]|nr:DNA primase [Flavobacteriales bacterium]